MLEKVHYLKLHPEKIQEKLAQKPARRRDIYRTKPRKMKKDWNLFSLIQETLFVIEQASLAPVDGTCEEFRLTMND